MTEQEAYEVFKKIEPDDPGGWWRSLGTSGWAMYTVFGEGCEALVKDGGLTYTEVKMVLGRSLRVFDAITEKKFPVAVVEAQKVIAQWKIEMAPFLENTAGPPLAVDYEALSDEPKLYQAPFGLKIEGTKRKIVEVGRIIDGVVTTNLKLLFERTVCREDVPQLGFAAGTSEKQKEFITKAYSPDKPDFVPTLALCCTAQLLGRYLELSRRKMEFVGLFRPLIDLKIEKLRARFPELPTMLSNSAYAICYSRYLEHDGKVGMLFTPFLGYVRARNRGMVEAVFEQGQRIESDFHGNGKILSMFTGLVNHNYFVPISDNPNVFEMPDALVHWFTRNVPLASS